MNSLLILTLAAYAWLWISLLVNVIIQHTLSHTHRHSLMYYMNKDWERDIRNVIPFRTRYYQSVMSRGSMHYHRHRHQHRPVPNPMGAWVVALVVVVLVMVLSQIKRENPFLSQVDLKLEGSTHTSRLVITALA